MVAGLSVIVGVTKLLGNAADDKPDINDIIAPGWLPDPDPEDADVVRSDMSAEVVDVDDVDDV
jgi:hypothetical protein